MPDEGDDTAQGPSGTAGGVRLAGRFRVANGQPVREGRGEVLYADDEKLGRQVVLKRTSRGEARACARVRHRHIVTVYDVLEIDDGAYRGVWLVMERLPGGSLSGQRFGVQQAARIGEQLADALVALHSAGLVHCDVKPANVVRDRDGTVKLADFDAAQRIGGMDTISPDVPIAYTTNYAAPELINGLPVAACDVFSLGATVHALVTGVPPRPWADANPDGAGMAGLAARPDGIQIHDAAGPLRPILEKLLKAARQDRPTAEEARRMLAEFAQTSGALPLPAPAPPPADGPDAGSPPASAPRSPAPVGEAVTPLSPAQAGEMSTVRRRGRGRALTAIAAAMAVALIVGILAWPEKGDESGAGPPAATPSHTANARPEASRTAPPTRTATAPTATPRAAGAVGQNGGPASSRAVPAQGGSTRSGSGQGSGTPVGPRIEVSVGPRTSADGCSGNCFFVEFLATGLKPDTDYHFEPWSDTWGQANPGVTLNSGGDGRIHSDDRFPFDGDNHRVWVIGESKDGGDPFRSNTITWPSD
ncbi:serine/threonine-protein kinase [Phytohabitans sp. ZYX-F-186]|uniref:non-specific serine/threonine protein kinase n=1 Tax=Phytohabitans maris TaxID=3071409 RepID=A0ABU0ZML7_9ACTN|nr:serine/threonine-protein kinase [Phytohabitans sp. ZYX-F-186]MDQ7908283.1 serine/threonine-protein kinase [Phytohabitans sp. ZYX-F-186]